jgi:undecaprenyl-diphosphatase
MTPLQAVILGLLQGVFEWLPVSSEAVVTLVMKRWMDAGVVASVDTAIWLHIGTMFAALLYLRDDFSLLLHRFFNNLSAPKDMLDDPQLSFLLIATAATALLGGAIYLLGLEAAAAYPNVFITLMSLALLITGLLRLYQASSSRTADDLTKHDSVVTGLLQGLAILPGISRSGSTVFGLLYRDFSAEEAFRLSFILSVPAILIANIGIHLFSGFQITVSLLLAAAVAAVVGYLTIDLVLRIADRTEIAYICFLLAAIAAAPLLL